MIECDQGGGGGGGYVTLSYFILYVSLSPCVYAAGDLCTVFWSFSFSRTFRFSAMYVGWSLSSLSFFSVATIYIWAFFHSIAIVRQSLGFCCVQKNQKNEVRLKVSQLDFLNGK